MRIKFPKTYKLEKVVLILEFICLIFLSCKKDDKDVVLPNARFISPTANSLFSVYDTLNIKLELSDETQLKKVEIYIKDEFDKTILDTYSKQLNEKNQTIEIKLIINDYRLENGNYTIYADVYDEVNRKSISLPIFINGAPNYLKKIYCQFFQNTSQSVKQYDSIFNFISNLYDDNTFFSFETNAYYQQYYICNSTLLKCYDISTQQLLWQNQINGISNSSCANDKNSIYVSLINGNCAEYSHQGVLRRSYLSNETNFKINHLFECGNYLIINLKHNSLSNNFKTIFFEKGTSIIKHVLNDNLIYKKAFLKSDQEIYLLSETGDQSCQFVKWNSLTNTFTTVFSSTTKINDAAQINNENLIFCCSDGTIKEINLSTLTIFPIPSGKIYNQICYSDFNQKIYAYFQGGLDVLQKQGLNLINQQKISLTDSLVKIKLLNMK